MGIGSMDRDWYASQWRRFVRLLRRLLPWAIAAVGLVALLNWLQVIPSHSSGRYLVTAQVTFEGRSYEAQTVWELHAEWGGMLGFYDPDGPTLEVRGEALAIPLDDGRTLFLLRRGYSGPPSQAFGGTYLYCVKGKTTEDKAANLPNFAGACDLTSRLSPRVVVADQNGNLTIVPYATKTSSGQGITIISLVAESTNAGITYTLLARYPWIRQLTSGEDFGSAKTIYIEDFSRR